MKKKIMAVLATIAAVLGVPCRHIPAERIRHRVLR